MADELRSLIVKGDLPAGAKLPSEWELTRQYDISRPTVSRALAVLQAEGLIDKHQGAGSFVRPQRPLRHPKTFRYEGTSGTRPMFSTDAAAVGGEPSWEYHSTHAKAPAAIAARLGIASGDPVMLTTYRYLVDGEPVQLATAYEPLAITGGTPVEWPEEGDIRGVRARMESIGVMVDSVTEEVTCRQPHQFETERLDIAAGVQVFQVERTYWYNERAVETADIVIPGDRYALRYRIWLR